MLTHHKNALAFTMAYFLKLLILCSVFFSPLSWSQADKDSLSSLDGAEPQQQQSIDQALLTLIQTIEEKQQAIEEAKQAIKRETDEETINNIQQKILIDQDIIQGMREQFISISAGGEELFAERKQVQQEINWREDLEAIFAPLIEQLKEISERPKLIEELEQDVAYWSKRRESLNRAVNYIKTTKNVTSTPIVSQEVKELLAEAQNQYETAGQKLALLQAELENIRGGEDPLWANVIRLANSFITSILYYFLLALLLAFFAYQLVAVMARIPKLMIDKRQPKRYVFAERTINLAKTVVGLLAAIFVYLTVLYGSGQWVLLVISLFLLAGLVLTLRNFLPQYLAEIRTLLNLGSIRQGERIIFDGLIWRISLVDIHTHLHNPALDAHLRVPIAKLVDQSSRPYHKDEPWFPTKPQDVVLLDDGVYGAIKSQSMDMVEVDFGGSIYTYPTQQFLEKRPRNLSSGFTVFEVFGYDYQHQALSTTDMLSQYKEWVEESIKSSPMGEHCRSLRVEFDKAASSSLDFKVIAEFSGEAAEDYFRISRVIQKASVDIANQQGWTIPFQQMTVHHVK